MKPLHSFIRGGQLAVHGYRMLKQVCVITLGLTVGMGIVGFFICLFNTTTPYERKIYRDSWIASFRLHTTFGPPSKVTQTFTYPGSNRKQAVRSVDFLKNPWVQGQIHLVEGQLRKSLVVSLWSFLGTILLVATFFMIRGYRTSRKKLERGGSFKAAKKVKSKIIKAQAASDLNLDGFPLLKNKETSHILITGTTGSGKTNCFHTLLPQIRARPNRAVIVDLTGDFISRYYREGQDILLNPFDGRSAIWNPWGECLEPPYYDALAAAIVAESPSSEPFWEKASKAILSTALHKLALQGNRDVIAKSI